MSSSTTTPRRATLKTRRGPIRGFGAGPETVTADLAEPSSAASCLAAAPVTLLVNSASLFQGDRIETLDASALDAHFAVNLRAPLYCSPRPSPPRCRPIRAGPCGQHHRPEGVAPDSLSFLQLYLEQGRPSGPPPRPSPRPWPRASGSTPSALARPSPRSISRHRPSPPRRRPCPRPWAARRGDRRGARLADRLALGHRPDGRHGRGPASGLAHARCDG